MTESKIKPTVQLIKTDWATVKKQSLQIMERCYFFDGKFLL